MCLWRKYFPAMIEWMTLEVIKKRMKYLSTDSVKKKSRAGTADWVNELCTSLTLFLYIYLICSYWMGFPHGSAGEESTGNAGDVSSIPLLRRSPGEGNGYLLQYSGLENSMDCIIHGAAKSRTRLSDFHFTYRISENFKDCQVLSHFHPREIQRMKFF